MADRRQSNERALLFYRLLQNAVALRKINQEVIVLRSKSEGTKRRGRKRTRPCSSSAITNIPVPRGTKAAAAKAKSHVQRTERARALRGVGA